MTPYVVPSQTNADNAVSGRVVSGFNSTAPIVLVTDVSFTASSAGTNEPAVIVPPPVTASGHGAGSALIAVPGAMPGSAATAQWNFAAYPHS